METKTNDTFLVYGIVTGIATVIVSVLLIITNMAYRPGMSYLGQVPFIAGIILNAIAFSKANGGDVNFEQVFKSCFKATLIISLIATLWSIVAPMVFPDMIDKALEAGRAQVEKMNLSDEQIEKSMSMTRAFMKWLWIVALIGDLIAGAVFSVIGAAIAKRRPAPQNPVR